MGSSHPPEIELPTPVSTTTASSSPRRASRPWSKGHVADFQPLIDVTDGVASIQILDEIYANPEPLWRSFVVGHFIGDAPHVGSIHATVNRIWTMARDGSKIDVQFIEKNTVLFRIENAILRDKVIQSRYWHIADVPLVVREWSPESALDPLDLSAMPMWIDLKGVSNLLFSCKGLKCLSRAAGKYVKLHPNTERCTRLDVARVLVEVNLQKPLVEKISFTNQEGQKVDIEVKYPWLPPRCTAENVAAVSTEAGGNGLKKNAVADLLRDLECFYPILQEGGSGHKGTETNVEFSVGEVNLEKMIVQENTEERGQEITVQKETEWAVINGGTRSSPISDMVNGEASSSSVSATETVVSPSRFTVLTTLDEDIEDTEVEEGEVVSENEHIGIADSERPKDKEEHHNRRGKSVSVAAQKSTKKKVMRSRDLKFLNTQTTTKKLPLGSYDVFLCLEYVWLQYVTQA
ncbi:BnaC03g75400D [Brassica napus]|uniref:BnaC03g75400D protein n=1 Tax=Brassica napus TaxID=3708 RepID=A0A078IVC0_BRANA|nr:BnaC03g75400D [Brassica napus]